MLRSVHLTVDAASDSESDAEIMPHPEDHESDSVNDEDLAVNLVVGGAYFSLNVGVIKKYRNCYFAKAVKWKKDGDAPIVLERDSSLFREILGYLSGRRKLFPFRTVEWVILLRREASYYNIASLVRHCDDEIVCKVMDWCWNTLPTLNNLQPIIGQSEVALIISTMLPNFVIGAVDVSSISSAFFASLTSRFSDAYCVLREFQPELTPTHTYKPRRALAPTTEDTKALRALMMAIPTVPYISVYVESAWILTASPEKLPTKKWGRTGTAFCILKEEGGGGQISVTHNGVTRSISKAGECTMHLTDSTSSIKFSTGGTFVVLQCALMRRDVLDSCRNMALPVASLCISDAMLETLTAAVRQDLSHYPEIVLPLARLYSINYINLQALCFETDSSVLKEQEFRLFTHLRAQFNVTLVTVCYCRDVDIYTACMLGPAPVPAPTTTGTSTTIEYMDSTYIVPLPRGYGRMANDEFGNSGKEVTLATGLHILLRG